MTHLIGKMENSVLNVALDSALELRRERCTDALPPYVARVNVHDTDTNAVIPLSVATWGFYATLFCLN